MTVVARSGPGLRPGVGRGTARRVGVVTARGWDELLFRLVPGDGGGPHGPSTSALALLVPRVGADHHDPAVTADHPALVADLLDARLDLHGGCLTPCRRRLRTPSRRAVPMENRPICDRRDPPGLPGDSDRSSSPVTAHRRAVAPRPPTTVGPTSAHL